MLVIEVTVMQRPDYDVIVVGARCAGAALSTFLARAGASVLVIDKAPLPSDVVLSTHTLHPAGTRVLESLGLANALRARSPEIRTVRLRQGDGIVDVPFEAGRGEYCPRRFEFDDRLQRAAAQAGAELRDRTELRGLLRQDGRDGRVTGVRLRDRSGERSVTASLVVGADGRASTVARLVGAEEYLDYDAPRGMYWSYWRAPPDFGSSAEHPFGMYVGQVDEYVRVSFHTDDDCVLVGCLPPIGEAARWKADPLGRLREVLALDPTTRPLVIGEPVEKVRGLVRTRYFFRRAAGPGWLLVGDAGIHKEFITGDGMTEALIQADNAARAIVRGGRDHDLERFWRERDVLALPWFMFGKVRGVVGEPEVLDEAVFRSIRGNASILQQMAASMAHEISPLDAIGPARVLGAVAVEALRGRFRVLSDLSRRGRLLGGIARELEHRKRLLGELDARARAAGAPGAGPSPCLLARSRA